MPPRKRYRCIYGSEANGIQVGSKSLLQHGLTPCTTRLSHEGEGCGPPLCDPRLDTGGPRGIDAYGLPRHTGGRGPEPSPRVQTAEPFHADLWWCSRWQDAEAHEILEDGTNEACLVDPHTG